jgi:hypothetical protein
VVLLWGRVIQHEHGYRAEYARPLKLLAIPDLLRGRKIRPLIEAVAQRYAIEVVSDVGELTRRCPAPARSIPHGPLIDHPDASL